jgi:hypothetical protein
VVQFDSHSEQAPRWLGNSLLGVTRAQHPVFIFSFPFTRLDPLALGIAAAVLLWKKPNNLGWASRRINYRRVVDSGWRLDLSTEKGPILRQRDAYF